MIKTTKKIKRVAIFGDAEAKEREEYYKDAFKTAELLAENGYIVVNGGGPGIMMAATLGAKAGGGRVEQVIMNPKKEPDNYEGSSKKSTELADLVITTDTYPQRLNKLVEIADAFVVCRGGTGTLSEMALVWELAKFDYGHHEPIIFLGKEWGKIVEDIIKGLKFEEIEKRVVTVVETPEEVIKCLKQAQKK